MNAKTEVLDATDSECISVAADHALETLREDFEDNGDLLPAVLMSNVLTDEKGSPMCKRDNGELPPPLTHNSSKAEMWENIQAMEQEIANQQREIKAMHEALSVKDVELASVHQELGDARTLLNTIRVKLARLAVQYSKQHYRNG